VAPSRGGPEHATISEMARSLLPENVRWTVHGPVPPERVSSSIVSTRSICFSQPPASRAPCSMMEAMSCGIPVAATSVGGVPELVGADRGWLLPGHPRRRRLRGCWHRSPVKDHPTRAARRLDGSGRRICGADQNFEQFAGMLRSMVPSDLQTATPEPGEQHCPAGMRPRRLPARLQAGGRRQYSDADLGPWLQPESSPQQVAKRPRHALTAGITSRFRRASSTKGELTFPPCDETPALLRKELPVLAPCL